MQLKVTADVDTQYRLCSDHTRISPRVSFQRQTLRAAPAAAQTLAAHSSPVA